MDVLTKKSSIFEKNWWRSHFLVGIEKRPPKVPGTMISGNASELTQDPLGFFERICANGQDICTYRAGIWSSYFINHPEAVKRVLQENHRNYNKDTFDYNLLRQGGGNGLLTSDGDFWLKQRRMIQPLFNRKRIESFGDMMVKETERLCETLLQEERGVVDIAEKFMKLTLRIVGEALFSMDLIEEAKTVGDAFSQLNKHLGSMDMESMLPTWIPTQRRRRFNLASQVMEEVVTSIIERRRQEIEQHGEEQVPQDLLTLLLLAKDEDGTPMETKQIKDEVTTLLVAGHETTANALSWTIYLLGKHQDWYQAIQHEVDDVCGASQPNTTHLPLLQKTTMVLEESMRLYPPAWGFSRNAIGEDELLGYPIPKDALITISPYTLHRHPGFWKQPNDFLPQRFDKQSGKKIPKFAYIPFGAGPRLCIGKHFAMTEAILILATLAKHLDFRLDEQHPVEPEPLITLRPAQGIQIYPTSRK